MIPADPRSRKAFEKPAWTAYEVILDVLPEVFAWAYLLVPKDLHPRERRPVVVCQHGSEGVPTDTMEEDRSSKAYALYKAFAARLADQGFVVCAPHAFFRGGLSFRQLGRKTDPLKKTLWSITVAQHQRLLEWLATLPFADARRIGFYGLSGGGSTSLYIAPLLEQYSAVVCSAAFTEQAYETVTSDNTFSTAFHQMYQWGEFNIANTFGYAELAALIAPRAFMVERGHADGFAPDEWVAYEYARVERLYAALGIPERTRIEYFDGGHTIHGVGAFEFLRQHLNWPGAG
jgi:cephalosporin-C deacetylase-like acetyl esterase